MFGRHDFQLGIKIHEGASNAVEIDNIGNLVGVERSSNTAIRNGGGADENGDVEDRIQPYVSLQCY